MKKFFVVAMVTLMLFMLSLPETAFAASDGYTEVTDEGFIRINHIDDASILGEFRNMYGEYCYVVEKNGWTWILNGNYDFYAMFSLTGGVWVPETHEIRFDEGEVFAENFANSNIRLNDFAETIW